MTKRYTVGDELRVVDDNIIKGTFYMCIDRAEALKLADKLNEFHNENVRLNKENEQLKSERKQAVQQCEYLNNELKLLKERLDYTDDLIKSNCRTDTVKCWSNIKLKGDVE